MSITEVLELCTQRLFDVEVIRNDQDETFSIESLRAIIMKSIDSAVKVSNYSVETLMEISLMMVKMQLFNLVHPQEILAWTFNHLDTLRTYLLHQASSSLDIVYSHIQTVYMSMSVYELYQLKQYLLFYMQPFQYRVSVLVEAGLQDIHDSSFIPRQLYIPPSTPSLGTIHYFSQSTTQTQTEKTHIVKTERFSVPRELKSRIVDNHGYLSSFADKRSSLLGKDMFQDSNCMNIKMIPKSSLAKKEGMKLEYEDAKDMMKSFENNRKDEDFTVKLEIFRNIRDVAEPPETAPMQILNMKQKKQKLFNVDQLPSGGGGSNGINETEDLLDLID